MKAAVSLMIILLIGGAFGFALYQASRGYPTLGVAQLEPGVTTMAWTWTDEDGSVTEETLVTTYTYLTVTSPVATTTVTSTQTQPSTLSSTSTSTATTTLTSSQSTVTSTQTLTSTVTTVTTGTSTATTTQTVNTTYILGNRVVKAAGYVPAVSSDEAYALFSGYGHLSPAALDASKAQSTGDGVEASASVSGGGTVNAPHSRFYGVKFQTGVPRNDIVSYNITMLARARSVGHGFYNAPSGFPKYVALVEAEDGARIKLFDHNTYGSFGGGWGGGETPVYKWINITVSGNSTVWDGGDIRLIIGLAAYGKAASPAYYQETQFLIDYLAVAVTYRADPSTLEPLAILNLGGYGLYEVSDLWWAAFIATAAVSALLLAAGKERRRRSRLYRR